MQRGGLETWRVVQTRPGTRSGCLSTYVYEPTPPVAAMMVTRARGRSGQFSGGGHGRESGVVSLVTPMDSRRAKPRLLLTHESDHHGST